jgi:competence protein CoiA
VLVAQNQKGILYSIHDWTKDSLVQLRNREAFQCPSCKEPVLLRIGDQRIPHFAHVQSTHCQSFSEPESGYHLSGKLQLYNWLAAQSLFPVLEPYLKTVKQRPDLYVATTSSKTAIEFQCSTIDVKQFKERTEGYLFTNLQPLWILGGKRLKRLDKDQFHLSAFDWMFVRLIHKKPSLLFYCSESKKFLFLQHILPLSSTKVQASLKVLDHSEITFNNLIILKINSEFPLKHWLELKKNWRLNGTQYPSQSMKKLLNFLYHKQVYPSLLPSEVGIPVPSMYWIQTSPNIWQAWILLEFIEEQPLSSAFSFQSVYDYFNYKKRNQLFNLRELPLISNSHYSFAIMEYLHVLVDLGILHQKNRKTFIRNRVCYYPSHIEEALYMDQQLMLQHKKLFV